MQVCHLLTSMNMVIKIKDKNPGPKQCKNAGFYKLLDQRMFGSFVKGKEFMRVFSLGPRQ